MHTYLKDDYKIAVRRFVVIRKTFFYKVLTIINVEVRVTRLGEFFAVWVKMSPFWAIFFTFSPKKAVSKHCC
jgi:hypothetical protein